MCQRGKRTAVSLVWGLTLCCPAKTCLVSSGSAVIQPLYLPVELLVVWCLISSVQQQGGEGVTDLTLHTSLQNSLSPSRQPEHASGVTRSLHALVRETVSLESNVDLIGCGDRWDEGLSLSDSLNSESRHGFLLSLGNCSTYEVRPARSRGRVIEEKEGERDLPLPMILAGAVRYQCCERSRLYHPRR